MKMPSVAELHYSDLANLHYHIALADSERRNFMKSPF